MVDRPLLGEQNWVAHRGDGRVELVGHVAGPAGSNVLVLDGIEIDLDVASPRIVCRVLIPDDDAFRAPQRRSLLIRLLGGHVVQEIVDLTARGTRTARIEVLPSSRPDGQLDVRIGALAAALHAACEIGRTAEEEAVALQEALVLADELGLAGTVPGLAESAGEAANWLATSDDLEFRSSDPEAPAHVAQVLRAAAARHPAEVGAGLRRLAALLPVGAEVATPQPAHEGRALRFTFSRDSLPLLAADRTPSLSCISEDEYEVRIPGWARRVDDWWVRAFVGDSATAVAVVPMLPDDDDAVATMLLPNGPDVDFFFDVVQDVTVRRADHAVAAFRSALAAGRRAAIDERRGRVGRARELWRTSSAMHEEAGDRERASIARAIADDDLAGSRAIDRRAFEALASDRLGPQNG
jgi:hypothetical protein